MKLKIISINILILISCSFFYIKNHQKTNEIITSHYQIIADNFINNKTYDSQYLGYIDIPKYNFKAVIKEGTTKKILDQNIVGLVVNSSHPSKPKGHTILAGHSIEGVFKILHKLEVGDVITLTGYNYCTKYEVVKKRLLDITNYKPFQQYEDKKYLSLITCTSHKEKGLVVEAKKV